VPPGLVAAEHENLGDRSIGLGHRANQRCNPGPGDRTRERSRWRRDPSPLLCGHRLPTPPWLASPPRRHRARRSFPWQLAWA
jgi:hypothetical protein